MAGDTMIIIHQNGLVGQVEGLFSSTIASNSIPSLYKDSLDLSGSCMAGQQLGWMIFTAPSPVRPHKIGLVGLVEGLLSNKVASPSLATL